MEHILGEQTLRGVVFLLVRLVEAAAALVIFAGAVIGFARFVLLTAAGLLQLAASASWRVIATAAVVVGLRKVVARSFTSPVSARGSGGAPVS